MPKKDQSSLNHCQTSDVFFPQEEAFSESAMHRRILKVCFLNTIQRRHSRERCGVFFVCFFQRFLPMTDRLTDWRTDGLTDWPTDRLTDWPTDRLWLLGGGVLFMYKPGGEYGIDSYSPTATTNFISKKTFSHCTFEILSCRMVNRIGTMAFQRSFYPRNGERSVPKRYFFGPTQAFLVVYPNEKQHWHD